MYQVTFKVYQETPMIHFESKLQGATIRGTELRPKIEEFVRKYGKQILSEYSTDIPVLFKDRDETTPSEYKIRVISENQDSLNINKKLSFMGNMGIKDEEKKYKAVLAKGCIQVDVFSFNKKIVEILKKVIPYVFLVENFGMSQSKGFGSFTAKEMCDNLDGSMSGPTHVVEPEKLMQELSCAIYRVDANKVKVDKYDKIKGPFELNQIIKTHYKQLKAGINVSYKEPKRYEKSELVSYVYKQGIRWEKARIKHYMKKNMPREFSNLKVEEKNKKEVESLFTSEDKYKYMRAMLGLADNFEFRTINKKDIKVMVTDATKDNNPAEQIERFPSPLRYKVHGKKIYIFCEEIPSVMFDKAFKFTFKNKQQHSFVINTPTKEEFNLIEFMEFAKEKMHMERVVTKG